MFTEVKKKLIFLLCSNGRFGSRAGAASFQFFSAFLFGFLGTHGQKTGISCGIILLLLGTLLLQCNTMTFTLKNNNQIDYQVLN